MDKHLPKQLIKHIAFFGDANIEPSDPVYKKAFEAAKLLAENGYTIVNGGGPGVMAASTKGAEEGHGETLTVTFYPQNAPGFEGRYVGNIPDVEIKTSNYIERMFKLLEHADVYIIFKGGTGTISEFGMVWGTARLYFGHHKPFILYGEFWHEIMEALAKNMYIRGEELKVYRIVDTPEEVLTELQKMDVEDESSFL